MRITNRIRASILGTALLLGACGRSPTAPDETVKELEIASAKAPCQWPELGATQCLQVRERSDAPWTLFYDTIAGFTYEAGYRYRVRVAVRAIANPPADGSSLAYRLLEVSSRVRE